MAEMHEYSVAETCIACDACCNDFPEVFVMNDDHSRAIPKFPIEEGQYNPWDVIMDCPVDAIALIKGTLPPKPERLEKKEHPPAPAAAVSVQAPAREGEGAAQAGPAETPLTWQERWEIACRKAEPMWERMKRYGMATYMEEAEDKTTIRFAMPERVPDHKLKFMWGLPDAMPDYKYDVKVDAGKLVVKAWIEEPNVKRLCGIANSFPSRFYREIPLAFQPKAVDHKLQQKVLEISLER